MIVYMAFYSDSEVQLLCMSCEDLHRDEVMLSVGRGLDPLCQGNEANASHLWTIPVTGRWVVSSADLHSIGNGIYSAVASILLLGDIHELNFDKIALCLEHPGNLVL